MPRQQLLAQFSETKDRALAAYTWPASDMDRRYAPGKWTIQEILGHLADTELMLLARFYRGVAEPGGAVLAFDQDAWARGLEYRKRHILLSKELFHAARNMALYYLEVVPESVFEHTVVHSEAGPKRVQDLLEFWAWHTGHHLDQIQAAREDRVWTPGGA